MISFEKIKKIINEKIFHKKEQKLLTSGNMDAEKEYDEKIDLSPIFEYIQKEKYSKDFHVAFFKLNSNVRKKLLKKLNDIEKDNSSIAYDVYPIVEGAFSQEDFISVITKDDNTNKVGQTIVTKSSYIEISTKKRYKNSNYSDLHYKEFTKRDDVENLYEYNQENESYFRKISKNRNFFYRICIIWK